LFQHQAGKAVEAQADKTLAEEGEKLAKGFYWRSIWQL
jgi:hypothetical protein